MPMLYQCNPGFPLGTFPSLTQTPLQMQKHARNVLGVEWTKKPFDKRRDEPDLPPPEEQEKDSKRK
jgi:hypothetical protein